MRIYIQSKEEIPKSCPYEDTMLKSVTFGDFFSYYQDTDGSIYCNSCGRNIGYSKKKLKNSKRDDNILK